MYATVTKTAGNNPTIAQPIKVSRRFLDNDFGLRAHAFING